MWVRYSPTVLMKKSKLIGIGIGVGVVALGATLLEYERYTAFASERVDPYTLKAVCRETTSIGAFGNFYLMNGPALAIDNCQASLDFWETQKLTAGCSKDKKNLVIKCSEAYKQPFR